MFVWAGGGGGGGCVRVCARARPLSIVSTDKIWRLVNTQIIISVQLTVKVHTTTSLFTPPPHRLSDTVNSPIKYLWCVYTPKRLSAQNTFDVCIPPKDFQHKIPLMCVYPQKTFSTKYLWCVYTPKRLSAQNTSEMCIPPKDFQHKYLCIKWENSVSKFNSHTPA